MFKKVNLEETIMIKNQNERIFLIENLIASNSLNLLTGVSTIGKTTSIYHLAKCIVDGDKWFGHNVNIGNVLVFDNEMGLYDFSFLCERLDFKNKKNMEYIEDQFIDIKNKNLTNDFYAYIENEVKNNNLKLVIIDSLSACCGNLDENSNTDMRIFMDFADKLSHICTTFVIHHKGKSENTEFRGASLIKDRTDNFFLMDQQGEIKIIKNRNGRYKNQSIYFDFIDDGEYISLTSKEYKSVDFQPKKHISNIIKENLEDGMNQTQLFEKMRSLGISFVDGPTSKLLKTMKNIEIRKGPNNASFYYHKS
jgi:hypothetical protein